MSKKAKGCFSNVTARTRPELSIATPFGPRLAASRPSSKMSSPMTRSRGRGIFHAAPGRAIPCVDVNMRPTRVGDKEMLSISIEPQAMWVHHAAQNAIRIRILGERGRSSVHHHDMGVMVADRDPVLVVTDRNTVGKVEQAAQQDAAARDAEGILLENVRRDGIGAIVADQHFDRCSQHLGRSRLSPARSEVQTCFPAGDRWV